MKAATEEQAKVTEQRGRIYAQLPQTAVGRPWFGPPKSCSAMLIIWLVNDDAGRKAEVILVSSGRSPDT